MRIGLATIYSFRPHVEHTWFIANLLRDAGHELAFLTCDGILPACYPREIKGSRKPAECAKCIAGGLRSYGATPITALATGSGPMPTVPADTMVLSSTCTLLRTERTEDVAAADALSLRAKLAPAAEIAYRSARRWIEENRLDGVVAFNGRMDVTRALIEACRDARTPFITTERTWFGDGLQLLPNADCLALGPVRELNAAFRDKPLTRDQAAQIGRLIALRIIGRNEMEWRAYNISRKPVSWPLANSRKRVLIMPSSWNERQTHPDWAINWKESSDGFTWLINTLGLSRDDVVVRCHPNWSERIGKATGERPERHYSEWCSELGLFSYGPRDDANSFDLIQEADLIIVNGSSAAFESGAFGKPIVCVGKAHYSDSGIAIHVDGPEDEPRLAALDRHNADEQRRQTLRFGFSVSQRFPQFTRHVRCTTPTRYTYYGGADPDVIVKMLQTGKLEPDTAKYASDREGEDEIVALLAGKDWAALAQAVVPFVPPGPPVRVQRRPGLRWLDKLRERFARGDRG